MNFVFFFIRSPDVKLEGIKFQPWTYFPAFINPSCSAAMDGYEMYFGGSVV